MSDGRGNRGRKPNKWIFPIICVGISPVLGIFVDICILFPPRADAHGHGIPVCSILFPLLASFAAVVIYLVMAANAAWKAVSSRGKHYEYIKSFWKYSDADEPVLTLHEIDLNAGRNGMRCIEIYKDGHAKCLENKGVYAPVPTVESINVLPNYTAYIIMKQEFEEIWNR